MKVRATGKTRRLPDSGLSERKMIDANGFGLLQTPDIARTYLKNRK